MEDLIGPSDYIAHLGANTGGANGVYWLELLGPADGGIRVRNIPQKGKTDVDLVEAVIEPDLLYPLLRWRDIARLCRAAQLFPPAGPGLCYPHRHRCVIDAGKISPDFGIFGTF